MVEPETLAGNLLLATLPDAELAALAGDFDLIQAELRESVYRESEPIEDVIFPVSGVFSLVSEMQDGRGIEVATVGNEGMIGLPVFLQGTLTSAHHAFCQIPGEAFRMSARRFGDVLGRTEDGALQGIMRRYTLALMAMISRAVACNALHSVQQRACRWLLQTHDRMGRDEFILTQEFLAQMLAVTRPSVNEVARQLQEEGAIEYTRGHVTVLDRAKLEQQTCECYGVIRNEFRRLLEQPGNS